MVVTELASVIRTTKAKLHIQVGVGDKPAKKCVREQRPLPRQRCND
jgi:hypothetical protein